MSIAIQEDRHAITRSDAARVAGISYPSVTAWLGKGLLQEPFTPVGVLALAVGARLRRIGLGFGAVRKSNSFLVGQGESRLDSAIASGSRFLTIRVIDGECELRSSVIAADGLLVIDLAAILNRVRCGLAEGADNAT